MTAPDRVACPVLTCKGDMQADATMCTACLVALPNYERVALDAATKAYRRQKTTPNAQRLTASITRARATAARMRA